MTFDEIVAIVFSFQKARDATVQEDTIKSSVNTAINQIVRETELSAIQYDPPAIPTVIGQDSYNVNASVFKILTMELTDAGLKEGLVFIAWRDWKERKFGTQTTGKPEYWTFWNGQIRLYPAPNKVYSITYPSLKRVGGLDAIEPEFHDAVLNGALAFFEPRYVGVFEKAKKELYAYWEAERAGSESFRFDADVETHNVSSRRFNVV